MLSRKSFLISIALIFFISSISSANMCSRMKSVSGGEVHTLALTQDNSLWACGGRAGMHKQLGLGGSVYNTLSLKQVLGEGGEGFLRNVVVYDAGWYHSLAVDANGTLWSWGYDYYGQLGNGAGNDPCCFPTVEKMVFKIKKGWGS